MILSDNVWSNPELEVLMKFFKREVINEVHLQCPPIDNMHLPAPYPPLLQHALLSHLQVMCSPFSINAIQSFIILLTIPLPVLKNCVLMIQQQQVYM